MQSLHCLQESLTQTPVIPVGTFCCMSELETKRDGDAIERFRR